MYIAFAFSGSISWISSVSFAIIALITLLHDVIISTWLYIYTWNIFWEFKIDTFFITALLTILWYSINDTIVVFDRIRENLKLFWWKKKNWKNLEEIINLSVSETLTRSIYTSLTVLFVLFTILFVWPETIKWFILTMIFGTIVWTYSSIFIASPLLYEINKNKKLEVYKEKIYNPDDKIVV
jgi:preprotein translocase SecF subunit